ncbi:MAG: toll/interleukin-1 receptor domain-containing protein [Anaerolineaceae bacterium]|nr:toll/interleukin-1 receptor domain-containing protein [Anaerolineaceae bacterium]
MAKLKGVRMGANPIIYCLENLTDYLEFERLATDLMVFQGYPGIEPLGGFSDKGRDALYVSVNGKTTIFAYSVRENWRVKLSEDATKIHKHGHSCEELVFVTTSNFSASERDEAITSIRAQFGWELRLYGLERLRVMLETEHPEVISRHPQIFNPTIINAQQILEDRKHLFISYAEQDWGLAEWLSRKLTAEGYFVWCERLKLLGGEQYPDNIDDAINNQSFRFIALFSKESIKNQELARQRYLALELGKRKGIDFLIPINVDGFSTSSLDRQTGSLVFIPFANNWEKGLKQLFGKLKSMDCPKGISNGSKIAANAYFGEDVLERKSEDLYLNYFYIEKTPKYLYVFESEELIPWVELDEIKLMWAFKMIDARRFFAFHKPPEAISQKYKIRDIDSIDWQHYEFSPRFNSKDLFAELLKKELYVKCNQKGLVYCKETKLYYFPANLIEGNRLKFNKPDGSKTWVLSTGKRTYSFPKEEYLYSLAPIFFVVQDVFEKPVIQLDIRVRVADLNFNPLPNKKRQSRRKHLCHDWWNEEWFLRMLAISQFLADDNYIVLGGSDEDEFLISINPICLNSPVSINENAIDVLMEKRKLIKSLLGEKENEDEEEYINYYTEEYDE